MIILGMPGLRFTYLIPPVWGKTAAQIRRDIGSKSPISGKMIMQDIIDNLTKTLSAEERKAGTRQPPGKPPAGKAPSGGPFGGMPISVVVTGGANNNYWSY